VTSGIITTDGSSGGATIFENPDGTALLNMGVFIGPNLFLGVFIPDGTDFTVSVDIQPGQAGRGTGSGTGHFTVEGVFAIDFGTGEEVGPLDVSVDLVVADASDVSASVSQGVRVRTDPSTGEMIVVRQHVVGSQACGNTAGSLSVYVDDGSGPDLVVDVTGSIGIVLANRVHVVERIN